MIIDNYFAKMSRLTISCPNHSENEPVENSHVGDNICSSCLMRNIRSQEESKRKLTISEIPFLILESFEQRSESLDQLLLVIYNLNTETENYEYLNASNRIFVIRNLLRLYSKTIHEHQNKQILALTKIINCVHSSELLVELAIVLHECNGKIAQEDGESVDEALGILQEKAAASLYPEALLKIHSIMAIK